MFRQFEVAEFKHGFFDTSYANQIIALTRSLEEANRAATRAERRLRFRAIAHEIVKSRDADMAVYRGLLQRPSTRDKAHNLIGQRSNLTDDEILEHVGLLAASLEYLNDDLKADMIDYLRSLDEILKSQSWALDALAAATSF